MRKNDSLSLQTSIVNLQLKRQFSHIINLRFYNNFYLERLENEAETDLVQAGIDLRTIVNLVTFVVNFQLRKKLLKIKYKQYVIKVTLGLMLNRTEPWRGWRSTRTLTSADQRSTRTSTSSGCQKMSRGQAHFVE